MLVLEHFRVIDLSHSLDEKVPTWSGGCGFHLEVKMDYGQGLRVQSLKCHAGVGTHMDAPSHFIEGGKNIGDIPLEECIVPLCVLHVEADADFFIAPSDLEKFERSHGRIPPKSLFLASTGWGKFWNDSDRYRNGMHFPGFSKEAAEFLLERGIVGLGIDTLSPDGSSNGKGAEHYPVHLAILGAGKYILENVAHLEQVPPKGAYAISLAPRVREATESACRLIALIPI